MLNKKVEIDLIEDAKSSQVALLVKNLSANAGDVKDEVLIPGSGRSPGGGLGNPLQYSCLENSMDRGLGFIGSHRVLNNLSRHA